MEKNFKNFGEFNFNDQRISDSEINTIEPAKDIDFEVYERSQLLANHRQLVTRQINDQIKRQEERLVGDTSAENTKNDKANSDSTADQTAIPNSVKKNFLQVKENFYFKDETLAFIDNGNLLHARIEHREVMKALVSIALERGWDNITIKGSPAFRHAIWLEANLKGIKTVGYAPSELDKVKLAELQNKAGLNNQQQTKVEDSIQKGINKTQEVQSDHSTHAKASVTTKPKEDALRSYVGTVKEHGAAKFGFDEKQKKFNYFVKLDTDAGEKIIWGVDLERAMQETAAVPGEKVMIDYLGSKPVTVPEPIFDEKGIEIGEQMVQTHRNTWRVTREQNMQKAETFKTANANDGVQQYSDLVGAYTAQHAAKKFVEQYMADHSEETKKAFLKMTEKLLAGSIENGETPLSPKVKTEKIKALRSDKVADLQPKQELKQPEQSKKHEQEIDR